MKLAVITHYYAPHIGGIETVAREQAQRLAARGWAVEVFTSQLRGDPAEGTDGAVRVRRYRAFNGLESALRVPVPFPSPRMLSALRRSRPDVMLVHGHTYISSAYASIDSRLHHIPMVLLQHSPWVDYPAPLSWVQRFADLTIGRFTLASANRLVAVSNHTANYVHHVLPRAAVTVIHSGVDITRFVPSPPRIEPARVRVATLRRLVPRQGLDTLIRAWSSSGLGNRADLVIGGTGPEENHLRQLAHGDHSISFVGRVPEHELVDFYAAADVFVLPTSSGEGFGLVAAEALASGRPVLATASGGPAELIRAGQDGLLVAPGDVAALRGSLSELVDNHELRLRLSSAAAQRSLGWGHSIDALDRVLSSVTRR